MMNINTKPATPHWRPEERLHPLKAVEADIAGLLTEIGTLKRTLRDTEERARQDRRSTLLGLIGVLDAFDGVLTNIEPREKDLDRQVRIWVGNFRSVRRLIERVLKHEGILPIEAPSGKAVPGLHETVETREDVNLENDRILVEVEKGYLWRGEVLRKARVIVVKN